MPSTVPGAYEGEGASIYVSGVCKQWTGLLEWITGLDSWTDLWPQNHPPKNNFLHVDHVQGHEIGPTNV